MQQEEGHRNRYLASILVVLVVVLFFPILQALGLELPQSLIEEAGPPLFFSGQPISVQAMVADPIGILAVRCYFRYRPDSDFVFIDMAQQANGQYQGFLPAPSPSAHEIDYLYLLVNKHQQVVRTPVYTVSDRNKLQLSVPVPGGNDSLRVQTDLAVPPSPASLLFNSEQLQVTTVASAKRFGLTAGLYNDSGKGAGDKIAQGYFGGYELQADGKLLPVKGIITLQGKTLAVSVQDARATRAAAEPPPSEIIGPDIAGNTWEGICYYGWGEATGNWYIWDPTPVTATVLHEANKVTITLSTECLINLENVGQIFQGSMDETGNMLLHDQRIPVQTWSSHWGPVTETDIKIGDYSSIFDPETNPYPDYYVIELHREYPPPPPKFLPGIYKLLLPQKTN